MKKIAYLTSVLSACVLASVSCQKSIETELPVKEHTVTFNAYLDSETKTVIDGNAAKWLDSDKALFHVFEDGTEATSQTVEISAEGVATITATFAGEETKTHTYTAFVGNTNTTGKASVKTEQNPSTSSYDPDADILFAKPITTMTGAEAKSPISFQFKRLVSVNKMTLKGIKDDETIQKVVLSSNYAFLCSYNVDGTKSSGSKLLTINTASPVVYFTTSAAENITLTATVTTDKAVYTKTFGPITFSENAYKPFGVTFTDRKTADKNYLLVQNSSDLADNDTIVIATTEYSKVASAFGASSYFNSTDATINEGILTSAGCIQIVIKKDGENWTLNTNEGQIGASAKNKLLLDTSATGYVGTWTISIDSETYNASITNTKTSSDCGTIQYNSDYSRFLNYTSEQVPVQIYKLHGKTPVFPCATPEISISDGKATITCTTKDASIRYTLDGSDPTESSSEYTAAVSLSNGQTIKARAFKEGLPASSVASAFYSTAILFENFDAITTGNSTSTSGSSTAWSGNSNFSALTRVYSAGGAIKLGGGSATGSITTKELDLSKAFTVTFDVKGWSSVEGDIIVTCGEQSETLTYTSVMSGEFEKLSVDFEATESKTVTIATSAKRAFIDNIDISYK